MEVGNQVFRAIGDPTRRAILDALVEGERSVGELTERFEVSQPAVSQHLKILREAGLVAPRRDGRRRLYRVEAGPLREVYDWVAHYERFWDDKLAALGRFLDRRKDEA
ncbi:MAG TPA: metalloregulator ArsR/SmtB family transcription factor [Sandaracinaceae bacterium LLY-WYZ-13_1]|nr:metalloregulator ArsR/SmtB family transcription factor [Sandaracinaceae bacterium LLY-WYZ-13_1]